MTGRFPKRVLPFLLTLLALVGATDAPARACVLIGGGHTKIDGEEVLIVWDAAHQTEHFIRHLRFADPAADFGFLVPTPTRPTLGDVDDAVFSKLLSIYRRPLRHSAPSNARSADGLLAAAAIAPVQVIEQRRVAGLDATVLAATDAHALSAWLGAHHYPSSPSLAAYLAPYVQQHFYVTAFRYAPGTGQTHLGSRAVRMSFTTDRPFFPYAEPTDAPRVPGRVFRVSVVSAERVSGQVGTSAWGARTAYARQPGAVLSEALRGAVPAGALPTHPWLTTFQEDASVRGRDDLFFVRAAQQSAVQPTLDSAIE